MLASIIGGINIAFRALCLLWHLIGGLLMVTVLLRFLKPHQQDGIIRRWSSKCLRILKVHMRIEGARPSLHETGILFVSNHISWIDVLALNAIRPMRFVAKAEVRDWPVIGHLAARAGTLFFTRRPQELLQVNRLMSSLLTRGQCVALFPEGTTSHGDTVLRFHSGLFQSAAEQQALVWPIALRYHDTNGVVAHHAAFIGDQSLLDSIQQVLRQPALHLHIRFLPTLAASQYDRYELAHRARTAILWSFHGHPAFSTPEFQPASFHWAEKSSAAS
jgi:1-acyl-sn-glycerol-3-phosphate acyltransferase